MDHQSPAVQWLERDYDEAMQFVEWYEAGELSFGRVADGPRGMAIFDIKADNGMWCEPMRWSPPHPDEQHTPRR